MVKLKLSEGKLYPQSRVKCELLIGCRYNNIHRYSPKEWAPVTTHFMSLLAYPKKGNVNFQSVPQRMP